MRLARAYLNSGIMEHGLVLSRYEDAPQGGSLSPLLANVLHDEVDKKLERRGHWFALRRRCECVCSQPAGGRAGDGAARFNVEPSCTPKVDILSTILPSGHDARTI
jgi:retron-type reverse transcriptase